MSAPNPNPNDVSKYGEYYNTESRRNRNRRRQNRYQYAGDNPSSMQITPTVVWDDQRDARIDHEATEQLRQRIFMEDIDSVLDNMSDTDQEKPKKKKPKKAPPPIVKPHDRKPPRGPPPPPGSSAALINNLGSSLGRMTLR